MPAETCLKCDHVNPHATGSETEACPQCGAIYSRVKAAAAAGKPVRPSRAVDSGFQQAAEASAPSPRKPATPAQRRPFSRARYVESLRGDTNYPAFRTVVRFGLFFGYLLAVCALIGGGISAFKTGGTFWHLLIGAGAGALLYLLTRLWFELTVMIVDIADASVRTAENSEPKAVG